MLKGCIAHDFVIKNRDAIGEITATQQLRLFELTYKELERDVKRISETQKNIRTYHPNPNMPPSLAWDNIPDKIKDVLVDLRYRGNYTPKARSYIQKMAYEGDLDGFGKALSNR